MPRPYASQGGLTAGRRSSGPRPYGLPRSEPRHARLPAFPPRWRGTGPARTASPHGRCRAGTMGIMTDRQNPPGTGPGVITPDGCAVDFYARMTAMGEPEIVHDAIPAGASILELGCGAGRVTHPLVALGHPVTAVDESPAPRRQCCRLHRPVRRTRRSPRCPARRRRPTICRCPHA